MNFFVYLTTINLPSSIIAEAPGKVVLTNFFLRLMLIPTTETIQESVGSKPMGVNQKVGKLNTDKVAASIIT